MNLWSFFTSPDGAACAWAVTAILLFYGWRFGSYFAYHLRTRFRFYHLRNQCVLLVAEGIVREDDEVFQFFYTLANQCAGDSRRLDFTALVEHITQAVLMKDNHSDADVEALMHAVKQRPEAFQRLVKDFYAAIWLSLMDSSTTLQCSEVMRLSPALRPVGELIFHAYAISISLPLILDWHWRERKKVPGVYKRAEQMQACLA